MKQRYGRAWTQWWLPAALTLLVGPLAGCGGSIVGRWHMVQCSPNRDTFAIDDAEFHKDGSFAATITLEGKTARQVGTYHFNGFKLTLCPRAGGLRSFNALIRLGKLEITDSGRKVVLKKGARDQRRGARADEGAGQP